MASRMFFNGRQYTTPTVASQIDDSAMAPRNPAAGNNLAIVGLSDAGQPNTLIKVGSPLQAKSILRSGELLRAAQKAFAPSSATGAASTIILVRVGTATQATRTLKDAAGTDSVVLTSEIFGIPANSTMVKVESGTISGKKLTTQLGTQYFTADNVARGAFTVGYDGSAATATVAVDQTDVTLSPAGGSAVVLALADFPTVQQLVDRINTEDGFTAVATVGSELLATLGGLDSLAATDAKANTVNVRMDLQAVVDWFNSASEGFVSAARATGAGAPPKNVPFTYLQGATNPPQSVEDWTNAISALQAADVTWTVVLSSNAAVRAALDAHNQYMSSAGGKERRGFTGGGTGVTKAQAIADAASLGSDRTGYVWPGHYDYDDAGNRVLLPGYMSAVHVAGGFAGMNPGEAMTNKPVSVIGLELDVLNPTDTDDLIAGGVCCLSEDEDGYKVVRSISTWLANDNYNRVEMSCGAASDFVVRTVRSALKVLPGGQATPASLTRAAAIAESTLRGLAVPQPAGPGVIVGDANSPAFTKPIASLDGDVVNVAFQCSPVIPMNFVQLGVALVPYAGTTAAAS